MSDDLPGEPTLLPGFAVPVVELACPRCGNSCPALYRDQQRRLCNNPEAHAPHPYKIGTPSRLEQVTCAGVEEVCGACYRTSTEPAQVAWLATMSERRSS